MDTIYKYFLTEMAWLEEAGKDFAAANPGLDTFLHGGGAVGDPHVDRILEGVAFLAARLDKRLDDSLLQVAEDILGLTYPELMEPQPAVAMVQFAARKSLRGPKQIPSESQLMARGQRGDPRVVRLRVADPVTVGDYEVTKVEQGETTYVDRTALRITLTARNGDALAKKEPLPAELPILMFWNNLADACTVRRCFAHMPAQPRFVAADKDGQGEIELDPEPKLELVAPRDYPPVLTAGKRAYPGFRLMREFFALPQRFMHCVIRGLDRCEQLAERSVLTIELTLPLAARDLPPLTEKNFLLFTSAVCNEWEGSAKPLNTDGTRERYPLEADHPGGAEILRISEVRMLRRGGDTFTEVEEFNYFNRETPSYRAGVETYNLSDTDRSVRWHLDLNNVAETGQQVVISADLALTNRDSHEVLGSRAVLNNYEGIPEDLGARMVGLSTEFSPALEAEGQYWQLVDMVASNLSSLADPLRLQMFLLHLNRTGNRVMAGAIRGIRGADLAMGATTLNQQPVKIATMGIDVDRTEFLNRGFLEMFFDVFYAFLEEFVPLNCLLELEVRDVDTKEILCRWRPEMRVNGRS